MVAIGQLQGAASTRELRRQVAGKEVFVDWHKWDHWGRLIGIVRRDSEDINLHMVDPGLARHYKRYEDEQTPEGPDGVLGRRDRRSGR